MKKLKSKWILVLGLLILFITVGTLFWNFGRAPSVSFREVIVKRGNLNITILTTGTVQPENRLEIKPPIAGRVEKVLVKEGQYVKKGQMLAWMSSTERAALLDAARAQGVEEVKKWEELYRPTPVLAPINGTIILRNVESGQTFTSSDPILVMSDRLTVKAQVDETDIAQVKLKQKAEIVLDAYSTQRVSARVDQIAFEAKAVNNVTTYLVDVLPNETPEYMRAGMTANVTFYVESKENILLVPNEAISIKDGVAKVLLRTSSSSPLEKEISVGISDGKQTEVIDGVSENDVVLVAQVAGLSAKRKQNTNPFAPGRGGGRAH